jgi:hypothetical protein
MSDKIINEWLIIELSDKISHNKNYHQRIF